MKYYSILTLAIIFSLTTVSNDDRNSNMTDPSWHSIDSLEEIGKLRSALELTEGMLEKSWEEKDRENYLKAVSYRNRFVNSLYRNEPLRIISFMEGEIDRCGPVVGSILHSMLGEYYMHYYFSRWGVIGQRSEVDKVDEDDVSTWSANHLLKWAHEEYSASLVSKETAYVDIESLGGIVSGDSLGRSRRPNVRHLLQSRAIEFYQIANHLQPVALPSIEVNTPVFFAPVEVFVEHDFGEPDEDLHDFSSRTVLLLQEILSEALVNSDYDVLADLDLGRLNLMESLCRGADCESMFRDALARGVKDYGDSEVQAEFLNQLALQYFERADSYDQRWDHPAEKFYVRAREYAEKAIDNYPNSYGAALAENLILRIREIDFSFRMDEVVPLNTDFLISLDYRNIEEIQLRVFKISREDQMAWRQYDGNRIRAEVDMREAIVDNVVSLPNDGNHHFHRVEIPLDGLPGGIYIVTANLSEGASENDDNIIKWAYFQSSNLAYIQEQRNQTIHSTYLVNRISGEPLSGVEVAKMQSDYDRSQRRHIDRVLGTDRTDKNGRIEWADGEQRQRFFPRFVHGNDTLYGSGMGIHPGTRMWQDRERVNWFLDRAVYRPGQVVYFKGIAMEPKGDVESQLIANRNVEVTIRDANRREFRTMELETNEYGAFYGSFTAPEGLLGRMTISVKGIQGSHSFRLEEYKRPTWFAEMDEIKEELRPGDTIKLGGSAKAYAGFPVSDAKVNYRVYRSVFVPWWYRSNHFFPPVLRQEMEIDFGETTTDDDGRFYLSFESEKYSEIEDCSSCIYNYQLSIDITDQAGESTTVTKRIRVSETPVKAIVEMPEELDSLGDMSGKLKLQNLEGHPVSRNVRISVRRLIEPVPIPFARKWQPPTHHLLPEAEFLSKFPFAPYREEYKTENWEYGDLLLSRDVRVDGELNVGFATGFLYGMYRLKVYDLDSGDSTLLYTGDHQVADFAKGDLVHSGNLELWPDRKSYQPGQRALIRMVTHEQLCHLLVLKEISEDEYQFRWEDVKNVLSIDLEEENRGGMHVKFAGFAYNRFFSENIFIPLPFDHKDLSIVPIEWNPDPAPGSRQEWKFKVRDKKGQAVQTRILASMYDKSLDDIAENKWNLSPFRNRRSSIHFSDPMSGSMNSRGFFRIQHPPVKISKKYPDLISASFFTSHKVVRMRGGEAMEIDQLEVVDYSVPMIDASAEKEEEEAALADESVRENFDETVFFFPELETDENGVVVLDFEMGEALTAWKLQILGITKDLSYGIAEFEATTSKDFIVLPNWPRFLMQGDELRFPVRLVNNTDEVQNVNIEFTAKDAITGEEVTSNITSGRTLSVSLEPGRSSTVFFELDIDREMASLLEISVSGRSANVADGERRLIPVLSSDIWITQTYPVFLKPGEKISETFQLEKGLKSQLNITTLEYTSDPFWLALQSLPFASDWSARNALQYFEQYYINAVARHLITKQPDLKTHIENWVKTGQLKSELLRNEDFTIEQLENTPWIRAAMMETESRERLANLMNPNQVSRYLESSVQELRKLQREDGSFSWFPGGPANWFITQRILNGFAALHQSGAGHPGEGSADLVRNALSFADSKAEEHFDKYFKERLKGDSDYPRTIPPVVVQYLYVKSQLEPWAVDMDHWKNFYNFAKEDWPKLNVQLQANLGVVFQVHGDEALAKTVAESLLERSRYEDQLGRWLEGQWSYYWYRQPIESHTGLIELLRRVGGFDTEIQEVRQWLLNQRRTNNWGTNSASSSVIQSLLTGRESTEMRTHTDEILVNGEKRPLAETDIQSGTGWFREQLYEVEDEVELEIENTGTEISWGAIYHQYFQDIKKVKTEEVAGLPLTLERQWMIREHTDRGPVLKSLEDGQQLERGQKLVGRIVLSSDRDMEYVHIRDIRPSALEPGNVLSGYRFADGLSFYFSSGDSATNFFIERLPRGRFVLEYTTTVAYSGKFNAGLIQAQSYFAPEFTVYYGEGDELIVK
jgi:hypothetical protein